MKNAAGKTENARAVPAEEHALAVLKPALLELCQEKTKLLSTRRNALNAELV